MRPAGSEHLFALGNRARRHLTMPELLGAALGWLDIREVFLSARPLGDWEQTSVGLSTRRPATVRGS
jgi:hypothetical protein